MLLSSSFGTKLPPFIPGLLLYRIVSVACLGNILQILCYISLVFVTDIVQYVTIQVDGVPLGLVPREHSTDDSSCWMKMV